MSGYNRPYDYLTWTLQPRKTENLDAELKMRGDEGWELAGIVQETPDHWGILIFKRLRFSKDA